MQTVQVQFVRKSSNAKIGAIPATNSERATCPDSCPLKGNGGCYAEAGFHTRLNWDKVDRRERGSDWQSLCNSVASLPDGQIWRHNVSGDLPHNSGRIDKRQLSALVRANVGRKGFTYTHHEPSAHNRKAIAQANARGFTVNLSANNPTHADTLAALNVGPVVTVLPADQLSNTATPDGRNIVVCPAAVRDNISCKTCQLCARSDRSVIVGFPAHGTAKRAADKVATS